MPDQQSVPFMTSGYPAPAWSEQAPAGSGINIPGASGGTSETSNPVMESLAAAMKQAQSQVSTAAQRLSQTPQYTTGSSGQPVMPVPSLKSRLFGGASVNNLANQQPQTRAGARNKAIGQIAAQGAGVVGKYFQKKEAEKTQALAIDIHKSLELQQGLDEAKQVLAQDPNNVQAKATIQKNQTLLTALLNGKSGKDIAKAYGVTFGEEAKDMSPDKKKDSIHYKAMQDAMKQGQQDQTRMQQFEAQQPSRMAPNPQYEAEQKQLLEIQKQADALTKTYTTMAGKMLDNQAKQDVADTQAASREKVATQTNQTRLLTEGAREEAETAKLAQQHKNRMAEIGAEGANQLARVKAEKNANLQAVAAKDWFDKTSAGITALNSDIEKLQKDKLTADKNYDKTEAANITANINSKLAEKNDLLDQNRTAHMYMFGDPDAAALDSLTNSQTLKNK